MGSLRNAAKNIVIFIVLLLIGVSYAETNENPPGIVIDQSSSPADIHVGCPSIAILPDGGYVASHSWFGPGTPYNETVIFQSTDQGRNWQKLCEIDGQWWSTLFSHDASLYIMGVSERYGDVVIRRSDDGGHTWSIPKDSSSGLLLTGSRFHCAPVPVVVHNGRIWRAYEDNPDMKWGTGFRAFMMSASIGSDLLKADSWTASNRIPWGAWDPYGGFLEGNAVVTPEGNVVDILRVHEPDKGGKAAMMRVSADGKVLSFDPEKGFIDFPGGCKKFTIRFDPASKRYWSLTNFAQDQDREKAVNAERQRNTLALTSSADLENWTVHSILLYHPDVERTGFQYADWQFERADIVAVCRTAFRDAPNCHDANYLTFHRITDFRDRTMKNEPLD